MTTSKPVSIAFQNLCTKDWIAGCNYLQNLFLALQSLQTPPKIVLLNMSRSSDDSPNMLLPLVDEVVQLPMERTFIERARYSVQVRAKVPLGAMNPIERALRQADVDVLFTGKGMGKDFQLPMIMWIPDLQHLHLPHMFSEEDRQQRDKRYKEWVQLAQTVVVSSQSARADMASFAPQYQAKVRILNFVAQVSPIIYEQDPLLIAQKYHLPEKYFYLPNQFWKHKNHRVVIEALALLKQSHPNICVVCSGNTYDYRQPNYFNELLNLIAEQGVHTQLRILGMIPFAHIFPLIRQSVAVVQPSLFEGWSTTVEETKSIGKQLILSDIAVHREQNPAQATYFDPNRPQTLADCLIHAYENAGIGSDIALEEQARANLPQRMQTFANHFMTIVNDTLSG